MFCLVNFPVSAFTEATHFCKSNLQKHVLKTDIFRQGRAPRGALKQPSQHADLGLSPHHVLIAAGDSNTLGDRIRLSELGTICLPW